jgi:hypothetical protein
MVLGLGRRLAEPFMFSSIRQLFISEVFVLCTVRLAIPLLLSNEIRVVHGGKKSICCTVVLLTKIIHLCQSTGRFIPGCYTLAVSEELPEEYQV